MSRTGARFEAIPTLNRVAAEVMRAHRVAVDDLYTFVLPHVREWQDPDQCHFRAIGNQALARQVSACVRRALA
jgi:lysophospholipase L1-like esterase